MYPVEAIKDYRKRDRSGIGKVGGPDFGSGC